MISTNILLGTIAAVSLFLGLAVARWQTAPKRLREILVLVSAGILLFLVIEVGYRAMGAVQASVRASELVNATELGLVFFIGFAVGLIGLSWLEEHRDKWRHPEINRVELAMVIALAIGLHNFAEGLAIGHQLTGSALGLGLVLVIGFALHNAIKGLAIAGPLVGLEIGWRRLLWFGLVAGGPAVLGATLGVFVSPLVELFFLSMATGSLIYVARELFRIRLRHVSAVVAMAAVVTGVFLCFGTELVAQLGQSRAIMHVSSPSLR